MDHTHPSSTTALLQAGQKQKRKGGGGAAGMSLTESTCGDNLTAGVGGGGSEVDIISSGFGDVAVHKISLRTETSLTICGVLLVFLCISDLKERSSSIKLVKEKDTDWRKNKWI